MRQDGLIDHTLARQFQVPACKPEALVAKYTEGKKKKKKQGNATDIRPAKVTAHSVIDSTNHSRLSQIVI